MKLNHTKIGAGLRGAVLLALGATLPVFADYPSTVLSQGPVGYWRFSETTPVANLSTIATNLGVLGVGGNGAYNGDLAGRGVAGAITGNSAAHFDGASEYVAGVLNTNYAPGDFSAEGWVAPDANTLNLQSMFGIGDTASAGRRGWLIYLNGGGANTFQLRLYNGVNTTAATVTATTNYTAGTYYHVAVTRSNAFFRLYVNGVYFGGGVPSTYAEPAAGSQFTVGTRPGAAANLANMFPGKVDEWAYYTNALDLSTIKAHYDAASTNAAGYRAQILAANPSVYLRLDEPPLPITANIGSKGAAANAKLVYPAISAVFGPESPEFAGLESTNIGVAVAGGSGSKLTGGYAVVPPLNLNTNAVTITCWLKPVGSQVGGAGIIMHRASTGAPTLGTSAGLVVDAAGGDLLSYNWDGDNATYNWLSGVGLTDSEWNFAALIIKPDSATIFVPNGPAPNLAVLAHTHAVLKFEGSTYFGTDPAKSGYSGSFDEVAIFNRALSLGEVYTQYGAATGTNAPMVFLDPQTPAGTLYAGDSLTLTVDAGGTPANLTYQWRKNGSAIAGTSSSYTIASLVAGGPDNYDVVITNNFGSVTSAVATISVQAQAAPVITQDILATNRAIYPGGSIKLSVAATGGGLGYQWKKNGTNLLGQTGASLKISGVAAADAGTYAATVSNSVTSVSSATAVIAIAAPPANTYEALIAADGPISWWRLDDAPSSPLMLDAMGNADGYYLGSGATLGTSGALANDGNKAATFSSGGWGEVSNLPPQAATGDFTYELWAKTSDLTTTELCPFSVFRPAYGFWFQKDTGGQWRGRDGYGELDGNSSRQALIGDVTAGQWTHIVAIYNSANTNQSGGHKVFINGRWVGTGPFIDFCRDLNTPMRIGALDPLALSGLQKWFTGDIDEVTVYNKALSDNQILAHYLTAIYSTNGAPVFKIQPTSQTVFIGATATFATLIEGSPTVGQQWYKNGVPIGTNNTSAVTPTLSLANTGYGDAIGATYYCVATNFVGSTTSSVVTLTVLPQPTYANLTNNLVLHLRFDGDFTDSSGHGHNATAVGSPTISAGHIGGGALHYSTSTDTASGHGGNVTNANYLTLGAFADGSDLSFSNNVSFSVSYWVKVPTNGYGSGDLPFFCSCLNSYQSGATSQKGMTFAPTYSSSTVGGWSWSLADGATAAGLYGPAGTINGTNAASHTLWHHLVHTFNRTTGAGITYLDGLFANSTGFGILDNIDSGNPFNIGQDPSGNYNETGTYDLDDLCVWKGRVLTATEAYETYYAGNTFGRSVDGVYPITITLTQVGTDYWIVWQGGVLNQADSPTGPWTPVPGAVAPYYKMTTSATAKYFKVK
jgi:hypothetical protein